MSQVNSGIQTKSCVYDFAKDGALGAGVFSFSGISIQPGEAVMDIKATRLDNVYSGSGGATVFSFGWGPNPNPGAYYTPLWTDTIANVNTYIWNLYKGNGTTLSFGDAFSRRLPATLTIGINMWFTSSAALTAGRIGFIVTTAYTKF